jgi:hypothetical protein
MPPEKLPQNPSQAAKKRFDRRLSAFGELDPGPV